MVTKHYFRVDRKDDESRGGWDRGYGPVIYESGISGFFELAEAKEFVQTLTSNWKDNEFRIVEVTGTTTEQVV